MNHDPHVKMTARTGDPELSLSSPLPSSAPHGLSLGSANWVCFVAGCILVGILASVVVLVMPLWVARRVTGATPQYGPVFAASLLRHLAVPVLIASLILASRWATTRRLSLPTLAFCGVLMSVGIYVAGSAAFWWYVDDDAGITFAYSRNLAEGYGLVVNPGGDRVEGYSNPLWLLILAGARLAECDIVVTAKVLGILFGSMTIAATWLLVPWRASPESLWQLAAPLLTATAAPFVIWNSSGLENSLHTLLLLGLVGLLARSGSGRPAPVPLALLLSLLVLSRPEGGLFIGAAFAYLLVVRLRRSGSSRWELVLFAVPAAVVVAVTTFRYVYFGDLLPNTFYAKATASNPFRVLNPFSGGWRYVAEAFHAGGWSLLLIPVLAVCVHRQSRSSLCRSALVVAATHIFFVITVDGDWMDQYRFISPIVPLLALLAALGLTATHQLLSRALGSAGRSFAILIVPLCVAALAPVPQMIAFAAAPTTPMKVVADIAMHFRDLAQRAGIENPTLLTHDAGGTTYVARIHLIDLGALCDRTIAKHRDDREALRQYIFHEQRPIFIYSAKVFADRIGLEEFPEFDTDYVPLPAPPRPELDGYIRRVRADMHDRVVRQSGTAQ